MYNDYPLEKKIEVSRPSACLFSLPTYHDKETPVSGESVNANPEPLQVKLQLCHPVFVERGTSQITSLKLKCFLCEISITPPTSQSCYKDLTYNVCKAPGREFGTAKGSLLSLFKNDFQILSPDLTPWPFPGVNSLRWNEFNLQSILKKTTRANSFLLRSAFKVYLPEHFCLLVIKEIIILSLIVQRRQKKKPF